MEIMARILKHNDYEKISDDIMWLNNEWILKFNVILNRYSDKYGRTNYHKEVEYKKNGYNCINITRSFDYFLSIESVHKSNVTGMKESIMIRNTDIYNLIFVLSQAADWFISEKHKDLFAKKNNKIFMPRKVDSVKVTGLALNKYIEFEPFVKEFENEEQIGVRIFIGSDDLYFFMEASRFLAFKYIIDNFNMYQSAQLMMNYINPPEYGNNTYSINDSYYGDDNSVPNSSVKRNVSNNPNTSFFNKISANRK